jgi:hypothetical protein
MNKWQIICPLVAMALFVGVLFFPTPARIDRQRKERVILQAVSIARDLEYHTNSTLLAEVSPQLQEALKQFLTTPTAYRDTFQSGDEPAPIGDGTATHRVYIRNFNDEILALRLRHDPKLKKFHVLSFSHPTSWPGDSMNTLPVLPLTNSSMVQ